MSARTPMPHRATYDVCPPWCDGHEPSWQTWEGGVRDHADAGVTIGGVGVFLSQEETPDGLLPPRVLITDNTPGMQGSAELTEAQAHELGMTLVAHADTIRAYGKEQKGARVVTATYTSRAMTNLDALDAAIETYGPSVNARMLGALAPVTDSATWGCALDTATRIARP